MQLRAHPGSNGLGGKFATSMKGSLICTCCAVASLDPEKQSSVPTASCNSRPQSNPSYQGGILPTAAASIIAALLLLWLLLLLLQGWEAADVIDAWLSTPFTSGYPEFKVTTEPVLARFRSVVSYALIHSST
jgi:hypothetical protein